MHIAADNEQVTCEKLFEQLWKKVLEKNQSSKIKNLILDARAIQALDPLSIYVLLAFALATMEEKASTTFSFMKKHSKINEYLERASLFLNKESEDEKKWFDKVNGFLKKEMLDESDPEDYF